MKIDSCSTYRRHRRIIRIAATFEASPRALEAHFLGSPNMSGIPDYQWPVRLRISHWLRDQIRFDSVAGLTRQIEDDCRRTVGLLAADAARGTVHA